MAKKLQIGDAVSFVSDIKIDDKDTESVEIKYADLVVLAHENKLVDGQKYRIIDFITTIYEGIKYDATVDNRLFKSAGHQFDIIVTAISKNKLSTKAKAAHHAGDTYFQYSDLDRWELGYELEVNTALGNAGYELLYDEWLEGTAFDGELGYYIGYVSDIEEGPEWFTSGYQWWQGGTTNVLYTKTRNPQVGDKIFIDTDFEEETEPEEPYGGFVGRHVILTDDQKYKGRIIFMRDEFNNSAAYDFKNIEIVANAICSTEGILDDRHYFLFDRGLSEADASTILTEAEYNIRVREYSTANSTALAVRNNRISVGENMSLDTRQVKYMDIPRVTFVATNSKTKILNNTIKRHMARSSSTNVSRIAIKNSLIQNINIGYACTDVVLNAVDSYSSISIGDLCSQIYLCGGFDGPVVIEDNCGNIKVRGYHNGGTTITTTKSEVFIGSNSQAIELGDMSIKTTGVFGPVRIAPRAHTIKLLGTVWAANIGGWATNITTDPATADNKCASLQNITIGEHCTDIKFKLTDTRGATYQGIQIGDRCSYFTFDQNNTGQGTCTTTIVQNIVVDPGVQSSFNTSDARFYPVSGKNTNLGQTYFSQDANGDTIMHWYSSGVTQTGKKWDSTNKVWVAL